MVCPSFFIAPLACGVSVCCVFAWLSWTLGTAMQNGAGGGPIGCQGPQFRACVVARLPSGVERRAGVRFLGASRRVVLRGGQVCGS